MTGILRNAARALPRLTTYDLLGYIAPGAAFGLSAYLFELWSRSLQGNFENAPLHTPIWTAVSVLRPDHRDWVLSTIFILTLLALAYLSGHVIGSISSLTIERVLVAKGYGYPFAALLGLPLNRYQRSPVAGPFYRGLFFWINMFLIAQYLAFFFAGSGHVLGPTLWAQRCATTSLIIVGAFIPIKVFASFRFVRPPFVTRKSLRYRFTRTAFGDWLTHGCAAIVCRSFSLPYDLFASLLSRYSFTREAFDKAFQLRYREVYSRTFFGNPAAAGTNNFWLPYLHVRAQSPTLGGILENHLHLYSFARNLATALYLFFLYGFGWLLVHATDLKYWDSYKVKILLCLPLGGLSLAAIMLNRYYYLYVSYFSKLVFRSFLYLSCAERETHDPFEEPEI